MVNRYYSSFVFQYSYSHSADIKMKIATGLALISLVGLVLGAPTSENEGKIVVTKNTFTSDLIKYTGQHEIVNLVLPVNSLNINKEDSSEDDSESENEDGVKPQVTLFFVEADVDSNGKRKYQGLYVFKDGKATKILDHGRDAAASGDESRLVFFGAADGIYVYNEKANSADKYGTVDDSIIAIAKEKTGDVIYILTDNHEFYKISNKGTTKEKINDVVNAQQIVLDNSNNIYFYSDDKQAYVRTADGVKKIAGLPENPSSVYLIKPPIKLEEGVPFLVDNTVYIIYPDGSSKNNKFEFDSDAKPSAFASEAYLLQYYAYNKNIYEFNVLSMVTKKGITDLTKSDILLAYKF